MIKTLGRSTINKSAIFQAHLSKTARTLDSERIRGYMLEPACIRHPGQTLCKARAIHDCMKGKVLLPEHLGRETSCGRHTVLGSAHQVYCSNLLYICNSLVPAAFSKQFFQHRREKLRQLELGLVACP